MPNRQIPQFQQKEEDLLDTESQEFTDRRDKLKLEFPFLKAELTGKQLIFFTLFFGGLMGMGYGIYLHDHKMVEWMEKSARMQEAQIYILALPQSERDKLNLSKPDIIKEMERKQ